MSPVAIRRERPGDEAEIRRVTTEAFAGHPHSDGTEPDIVDALRRDGDLALSLVAESDGVAIGHAAFSQAMLSTGEPGWFALGPVSVDPQSQRRGTGRALIEAGLAQLRERGACGIVVVGDPAYYARFGFLRDTPLGVSDPLSAYFQVLAFGGSIPCATVTFARAFGQAAPPER